MMQGRVFWLVWLLVGCQMAWMTLRAFQMPWTWNPYQFLAVIFLAALGAGLVLFGFLAWREGFNGLKAWIAAFETQVETPGSRAGLASTIVFLAGGRCAGSGIFSDGVRPVSRLFRRQVRVAHMA